MTEIDLSALQTVAMNNPGLKTVSVQITNTGSPGSVIGSLYGIDRNTGISFDVPLRDSGPVRTMTGSYPWKITDDFSTVIYVTNISDQEAQFFTQVNYPGGNLIFSPRHVVPGETAVFDLKQIREEGLQDLAGNQLPRNVSQGQFKWAVRGMTNGKLVLIGRAEMVSSSQHISSSYSCTDPCPPYYAADLNPYPPTIVMNGSGSTAVWETAYYEDGYIAGPYPASASWSPIDPIATINPSYGHTTTATGVNPGVANLHGFIALQQDYGWDGLNCLEYGYYEESVDAPVEVKPTISGPQTLWWFNGQTPTGYATQVTLTTSCSGSSWQWTVNSGTSKVTLGTNGSCSITVTSAAASSPQSDINISVTVNGVSSNPYSLTVRAPRTLSSQGDSHSPSTSFGYTSLIGYDIRDQFGTLLPSSVPINELFTTGITNDYPGTNWIRGPQGGATVSPNGWDDKIDGQPVGGAIPAPTSPCSPLCNILVHHFSGEWYVGSPTPGIGVKVQTNIWNRYRDHASHSNRQSPP